MYESEKNFLERIADAIPGLKGYREKEARRDTDKRLREYLAAEIDRHRRELDGAKRDLLSKGRLELLDDADRSAGKLQRAADSLRFASYGYSGLFDQVKIEEAELDRIYAYDEGLLVQVRAFAELAAAIGAGEDPVVGLRLLESAADTLIERIDARKQLFNVPA